MMEMALNFKEQISFLVEVQKIDIEISSLEKEKELKPLVLDSYRREIEEKEEELKSLEKEIKSLKVEIKEKELELKSAEEEIKSLHQKLLQVKTNKEYKAILNEITGKKADNSLIEDNILALMEKLDQKELSLNRVKEELKIAEQKFLEEERKVKREIAQLESEIDKKNAQRKEAAVKVEQELLLVYERLLKSRGGIAIVPVINDACGGCHLSLRAQIINEIKKSDKLVYCEGCSRILYLNE